MTKHNTPIRLTDELERQLMLAAIEEQMRMKPGLALKKMFVKLGHLIAALGSSKAHGRSTVESAS